MNISKELICSLIESCMKKNSLFENKIGNYLAMHEHSEWNSLNDIHNIIMKLQDNEIEPILFLIAEN